MFAKLSSKYKVANPLDEVTEGSASAAIQSTPAAKPANIGFGGGGLGFGSSAQTPFSSSGDNSASLSSQKPPLSASPFAPSQGTSQPQSPFGGSSSPPQPVQSPFGGFASMAPSSQSPFGSSVPAPTPQSPFGGSTPAPAPAFGSMASQSPFGQQSSGGMSSPSPFGQPPNATPSPFGALSPAAPGGGALFNGKTAREMLTAFYQEKNPAKMNEIEKVLAKYQGKEQQLFQNLARKYNIDPSVFGVPASAPATGFGAVSPGIGSSPGGFGQPSALGGGSTFGSPPPSFGASSFGAATAAPGQGFGSASGGGGFGGFGALAHSSGGQAGFGGFGSPAPAPTPFGAPNTSPFGAARR